MNLKESAKRKRNLSSRGEGHFTFQTLQGRAGRSEKPIHRLLGVPMAFSGVKRSSGHSSRPALSTSHPRSRRRAKSTRMPKASLLESSFPVRQFSGFSRSISLRVRQAHFAQKLNDRCLVGVHVRIVPVRQKSAPHWARGSPFVAYGIQWPVSRNASGSHDSAFTGRKWYPMDWW